MFLLAFANEVSSIANERLNTIELFGKMYSLVEVKYVYKDTRMIDISRHIADIVSILKYRFSYEVCHRSKNLHVTHGTRTYRPSRYDNRLAFVIEIELSNLYDGKEGIICQIEFRQAILVN